MIYLNTLKAVVLKLRKWNLKDNSKNYVELSLLSVEQGILLQYNVEETLFAEKFQEAVPVDLNDLIVETTVLEFSRSEEYGRLKLTDCKATLFKASLEVIKE